jgi:uncharacterized protein (TIGR02453 family)
MTETGSDLTNPASVRRKRQVPRLVTLANFRNGKPLSSGSSSNSLRPIMKFQSCLPRTSLYVRLPGRYLLCLALADQKHRIYRDVRFSSDKTPYKKSFSMSTSRGGRKGIWAGYYLGISPNGHSLLAAGVWQPGKDELATMRQNILHSPEKLRDCISRPQFVDLFGPPNPGPKGKRQNVFGHDDALKVAPKIGGVDKTHKDIDLLKLRSVAVVKKYANSALPRSLQFHRRRGFEQGFPRQN